MSGAARSVSRQQQPHPAGLAASSTAVAIDVACSLRSRSPLEKLAAGRRGNQLFGPGDQPDPIRRLSVPRVLAGRGPRHVPSRFLHGLFFRHQTYCPSSARPPAEGGHGAAHEIAPVHRGAPSALTNCPWDNWWRGEEEFHVRFAAAQQHRTFGGWITMARGGFLLSFREPSPNDTPALVGTALTPSLPPDSLASRAG
jgi:hypothetical protein